MDDTNTNYNHERGRNFASLSPFLIQGSDTPQDNANWVITNNAPSTSTTRIDEFLESLPIISPTDLPEDCKDCPVCVDIYQNDDAPVRLSCNHIMGKDCLSKWLKSSAKNANNRRCPMCRAVLLEHYLTYHEIYDQMPELEGEDTESQSEPPASPSITASRTAGRGLTREESARRLLQRHMREVEILTRAHREEDGRLELLHWNERIILGEVLARGRQLEQDHAEGLEDLSPTDPLVMQLRQQNRDTVGIRRGLARLHPTLWLDGSLLSDDDEVVVDIPRGQEHDMLHEHHDRETTALEQNVADAVAGAGPSGGATATDERSDIEEPQTWLRRSASAWEGIRRSQEQELARLNDNLLQLEAVSRAHVNTRLTRMEGPGARRHQREQRAATPRHHQRTISQRLTLSRLDARSDRSGRPTSRNLAALTPTGAQNLLRPPILQPPPNWAARSTALNDTITTMVAVTDGAVSEFITRYHDAVASIGNQHREIPLGAHTLLQPPIPLPPPNSAASPTALNDITTDIDASFDASMARTDNEYGERPIGPPTPLQPPIPHPRPDPAARSLAMNGMTARIEVSIAEMENRHREMAQQIDQIDRETEELRARRFGGEMELEEDAV